MKQLLLFSLVVLISSCGQLNPCGVSTKSFINNYESFVDEVAEKDLGTKAESWKAYDQRFEKFVDECYPNYEDKLSRSEKSSFASATVKYLYHRYAGSLVNDLEDNETLEQELEELGKTIGSYAEKFGADVSDAMNDLAQQLDREKLDKMLEDVSRFFENLDISISTGDK